MNVADSSFLSVVSPSINSVVTSTGHLTPYIPTMDTDIQPQSMYPIRIEDSMGRTSPVWTSLCTPHHSPHRLNTQGQWKAIRVQTTQTQILQGSTSSHIRPLAWIV